MKKLYYYFVLLCVLFSCKPNSNSVKNNNFEVIAYYVGDGTDIGNYDTDNLTQIIYSFLHLDGNNLSYPDEEQAKAIQHLVALKDKNPNLKILVSLGGWGGCETCSQVFSTEQGRLDFANSTKKILDDFNADGIDLDWEYPSIVGHPGHLYQDQDKDNFTALAKIIREKIGDNKVLSFAAGGYDDYLYKSVDWKAIAPIFDNINLMSYDLTNGYSPTTGHHTPIYSNPQQKQSTHNAIEYFKKNGIPLKKVILGAAFYGRVWENVEANENGLYQAGKFKASIDYKELSTYFDGNEFEQFFDTTSQAPYAYSPGAKLFVTYDTKESVAAKTKYCIDQGLGGIMFWHLTGDNYKKGLLEQITLNKPRP